MFIEANKTAEDSLASTTTSAAAGYVLRISLTAALAGFIFGFDTVVISGANLPIKELWHTSPWFHGFFIMSMALWGTVIGAIFGGLPTEKWGRKKVLIWIGLLFSLSAIGTAIAPGPYSFSFFRFLGGLGIGVSSVAAPTYISEISTPRNRGKLVALYQFNIVFGILVAFLSNYFLKGVGGANDWRYMLGALAVPSLIYSIMVVGVPESPRWLITKKKQHFACQNHPLPAGHPERRGRSGHHCKKLPARNVFRPQYQFAGPQIQADHVAGVLCRFF